MAYFTRQPISAIYIYIYIYILYYIYFFTHIKIGPTLSRLHTYNTILYTINIIVRHIFHVGIHRV